MNHLDGIHQRRKSLDNLLRSSSIKRFNKLLKCHQIFNVVLGFIKSVCQGKIKSLEAQHQFIDILLAFLFAFILFVFDQVCFDHVEILALELF